MKRRRRLMRWAMTALPVASLVAQLPDLDGLHRPATLAQRGCLILLLILASFVRPRLGLKGRPMFLIGFALWTIPFLWTTVDGRTAVEHRFAWAVMVVAAVAVARVCTDVETTWALVLEPLRRGMVVAVLIVALGVVLDPDSLRSSFGRFMPWGANPNILASNLVAGLPLFGYTAMATKQRRWLAATGLAAGLVLVTGSRGGYLAMALIAVPFVVQMARRPALALTIGASLFVAGSAFLSVNPTAIERAELGSVSSRANIAGEYADVISTRPWVGLLFSRDQRAQAAEEVVGQSPSGVTPNPHSAYIQYGYWGGIALAGPLLAIAFMAGRAAWRLWRKRERFDHSMLVAVVCWTTIAVYAHGVTGIMIVFPTYTWAWLGLLATLLVWQPRSLRQRRPLDRSPAVDAKPLTAGVEH